VNPHRALPNKAFKLTSAGGRGGTACHHAQWVRSQLNAMFDGPQATQ
jgi:hypothetical protein